jgi:cytidylate kinase
MAAQVICISRTHAALGERIGDLVATQLGFRYVDEQVIERAARLAQVDPKLVAAVEERQTLMQGLIEKLAAARELVGPAAVGSLAPVAGGGSRGAERRVKPSDLRLLIQAAVREIAKGGRAVIVAHAASITLAMHIDVLRVLVTASAETRAHRLTRTRGVAPEAAASEVAASDRSRRSYLRRFHAIAQELPTHYDLVVNTDVLGPESAAEIIVCAARG